MRQLVSDSPAGVCPYCRLLCASNRSYCGLSCGVLVRGTAFSVVVIVDTQHSWDVSAWRLSVSIGVWGCWMQRYDCVIDVGESLAVMMDTRHSRDDFIWRSLFWRLLLLFVAPAVAWGCSPQKL